MSTTVTAAVLSSEQVKAIQGTALYASGTAQQQAWLLEVDAPHALAEMDLGMYLEGLSEWPDGLASYQSECAPIDSPEYEAGYEAAREYHAKQGTLAEFEARQAGRSAATAPVLVDAAVAAAEQERLDREAEDKATGTLKAAGKAVKAGEKSLLAGYIKAGQLSDLYIRQKLAINRGARARAVEMLKLELSVAAGEPVDPNRLIAVHQAYELLTVVADANPEQAEAKTLACRKAALSVTYTQYRSAWSQLVDRKVGDTGDVWSVLPGLESECRAAFQSAVTAGIKTKDASEQVELLVGKYDVLKAKAKRDAETLAAKDKAESQRVARLAAAELATKQAELERAEQQASEAAAEVSELPAEQQEVAAADAEAKAGVAEVARKALLEQQRATIAANAKAEQDAKDAATAKRVADEADAKLKAAQDKASRKAAGKPTAKDGSGVTVTPGDDKRPEPAGGNLIRAAKQGSVKDVAGMAVELVTGGDQPDDVLVELLNQLKDHAALSKQAHRVVNAALLQVALEHKRAEEAAKAKVA